jgi:hypothetical protein
MLVLPAAFVLCLSALARAGGPAKKPMTLFVPPTVDAKLLSAVREHLIERGQAVQAPDGAEVCLGDGTPSNPGPLEACLEAAEVSFEGPVRPAVMVWELGDLTLTVDGGDSTWIIGISPQNVLTDALLIQKDSGAKELNVASPQVQEFVRSLLKKVLGLPVVEA